MWDKGEKKEEVNIKDTPHLAYYKENKALSKTVAEYNNLARISPNCWPLNNIFKNLYISDVDLQKSLVALREIHSEIRVEEMEGKILDLFPKVQTQYPDELFPQMLQSKLF